MKKAVVVFFSIALLSFGFSSCRTHERCAAYGKINKIDTGKTFTDKSQRSI